MDHNPHFEVVDSWKAARALLTFAPREPTHTAGYALRSLHVHILDHRQRSIEAKDRTLEAHYGGFVLSLARHPAADARRIALEVPYGAFPRAARIAGHDARVYELGPEVEPDDADGRSPAVVTWADGEIHCLLASTVLTADELVEIAASMQRPG